MLSLLNNQMLAEYSLFGIHDARTARIDKTRRAILLLLTRRSSRWRIKLRPDLKYRENAWPRILRGQGGEERKRDVGDGVIIAR